MSKEIKCTGCGNNSWQSIEFKEFGKGMRKGYIETYRCTQCGQVRTQIITIQNEQRKVVIS